ncbi:Response regulator receiver domain-containing protein [Chryseobacterium soldanellicola]|uniref:Response regulator receiver domain-containing protein n=1 Tax=Chryseobacterium soldanellicola TaxID=311333 RepID=A0A1H0YL10_9FLAO|nr:response regulator [Chryseobacterium soldanellicola]SDQ15832.1 Response regulator receiver domain-containing protein [Chryseobacterium soldanellicola]
MNKEYLNVILADDDEGNIVFLKNILKELKIRTKVQAFQNGADLMKYLNSEDALIPEIIFMDFHIPTKNALGYLHEIKSNAKLENMVTVIYSNTVSEAEIENVFVNGGNIFMKKPNEYSALKKVVSEIITINWQYHTSGFNKDNFIMKIG